MNPHEDIIKTASIVASTLSKSITLRMEVEAIKFLIDNEDATLRDVYKHIYDLCITST